VRNFKSFWFETLKQEGKQLGAFVPANTLKVPDLARDMVKETEKHARSFNAVVMLNKKVHVARYNIIMVDCISSFFKGEGSAFSSAMTVSGGHPVSGQ
jgi:hypothetical protein